MQNNHNYLSDLLVAQRYKVGRTTIWRWVKTDPKFPKPIKLSPGCTRWKACDLEAWEADKATSQ